MKGDPSALLSGLKAIKGVYYEGNASGPGETEKLYLKVRAAEGRIYSDQEALSLPYLKNHPHAHEWKLRARSSQRLLEYFRGVKNFNFLDLGCGNGWFARTLASATECAGIGLDLNQQELEQAARLSGNLELFYLNGDIFTLKLPSGMFSHIIIGAAIQYFPDLKVLLDRLIEVLARDGEIHIFDSPFYTGDAIQEARTRSLTYYSSIGFPEMAGHYHHHDGTILDAYRCDFLYKPAKGTVIQKILGKRDVPFPWVRIKKNGRI